MQRRVGRWEENQQSWNHQPVFQPPFRGFQTTAVADAFWLLMEILELNSWGQESSSSRFSSSVFKQSKGKTWPIFLMEKAIHSEDLLKRDRKAKMQLSARRKRMENNHRTQGNGG